MGFDKDLISLIDSYIEDMIFDLSSLIEIPSVTEDRPEVLRALNYSLDCGERLGFDSKTYLGGEVGVIEAGQGDEVVGILAHVDVVSAGDIDKWRTPPFIPVLEEEILYGRGALDDKGPVVASLYAMKAVADLGARLNRQMKKKIQLILGTREETEWTDMNAYVTKYPLPDYGFTPDGEFPICNIEKGVATLEMVLPQHLDGLISKFEGGTASNVVPGKCECVVKGENITIDGKAVHASQPEKGKNAIMGMAKRLVQMDLKGSPLLIVANMLIDYFDDREGAALGLKSESDYFDGEFVHRNIFTPAIIKANEEHTKITFDIRYAYGTDFGEIAKAFDKLASKLGGKVESYQDLLPVYVSSGKPFLEVFANAYERVTGLENKFVLAYGGSYAKAMPNIVSWGPIFPGDPDTCHEENEFITIEVLKENAKIFAVALWDIVMSDESFK